MSVILILTHENADFDAVASQLGAAKLYPGAIPVLSHHLNRTIKDFLTLYGEGLPFIRANELDRQQIDQLIVVDSQSFSPVKGLRPNLPTQFIDHHPLMKPLEPHQQYSGEPLGANTTLLVERIREAGISLSRTEATLLALGIYDDTGNLLYATTTYRDLLAAAWLREHGADLDIVRRFLERALNDEQKALYDDLLDSGQIHQIGGFMVLVATASVDHIVEEVAALAHKIRDMFEANAVILLIAMGQHVQMVARSAVDEIDVSRVATTFGGGGHNRAAAALIKHHTLEDIHAKLITLLPTIVKPAVQVHEMMSERVQTIAPDEHIEVAAKRMQRSGHEGYPVLERGKVIGLLTRRAVDRAMAHGLAHRTVREIMDRGSVSVRLDDSIEMLQQIMMDSGWGQIPVLGESGKLIGIVTRTDLIQRWGQKQTTNSHAETLVRRMRDTLSDGLYKLLEAAAQEAAAQDVGLYVVGGFVRDLLLGLPNMDIDLVVEGDAVQLGRAMQARCGGTIHAPSEFNTIKWSLDEDVARAFHTPPENLPTYVDFVTARREFYREPSALPTVEEGSIKLDLQRRDFTINALAIRLTPPMGKLLDFFGGERDLRNGILRVLHSLSFVDDPTRILRAVRFEQRFTFQIEPNTAALIPAALPFFEKISGERLRNEFDSIFQEALPEKSLRRLHGLGVLQAISPGLEFDEWLNEAFVRTRSRYVASEWPLSTVALPRIYWIIFTVRVEDTSTLIKRLSITAELGKLLEQGYRLWQTLPTLAQTQQPSAVVKILKGFTAEVLAIVGSVVEQEAVREQIASYLKKWQHVRSDLTGHDLMSMGVPEGPAIGKLLRVLLDARLDGIAKSVEDERSIVQKWLKESF